MTRDLPADLDRLERLATNAPQLVMPGQRWEVACAALSPSLPEHQAAFRFGETLAQVFARPMEPRSVLQVKVAEWKAVEHGWSDGTRALEEVWRRIDALDVSGGVGRMLRRKARRLPRVDTAQGPTLLVYAEFWRALAISRMEQIATARVDPALLRPGESFVLFGWLVRRQAEPSATLELDAPRGALLELAHLLSGSPQGSPRERHGRRSISSRLGPMRAPMTPTGAGTRRALPPGAGGGDAGQVAAAGVPRRDSGALDREQGRLASRAGADPPRARHLN